MLDRLQYLRVALVEDESFTKTGTSLSCAHLMLKSQQWEVAKDMADVLQIIEVAMTQLSGEKYPMMSLVLPLVQGLKSQLAGSDEEWSLGSVFKGKLRAEQTRGFQLDALRSASLPVICAALDSLGFEICPFFPLRMEEANHEIIQLSEIMLSQAEAKTSSTSEVG